MICYLLRRKSDMQKHLRIALIAGAFLFLPLGYALGQTQGEGKSKTEIALEQKIAKSTKIDVKQELHSRSFTQQKDGQTFTCMPPVDGINELPLFITAGYCQRLCGNDTPIYSPNWGNGQSMCHCSVKNKTYIY
jgi:hypothetical protein